MNTIQFRFYSFKRYPFLISHPLKKSQLNFCKTMKKKTSKQIKISYLKYCFVCRYVISVEIIATSRWSWQTDNLETEKNNNKTQSVLHVILVASLEQFSHNSVTRSNISSKKSASILNGITYGCYITFWRFLIIFWRFSFDIAWSHWFKIIVSYAFLKEIVAEWGQKAVLPPVQYQLTTTMYCAATAHIQCRYILSFHQCAMQEYRFGGKNNCSLKLDYGRTKGRSQELRNPISGEKMTHKKTIPIQ